jgi:serine/threonine protein kinase
MGRVYRAEVTRQAAGLDVGTAVALQVIHAHLLEQEGFFQRFLREANIGRAVQHDNVVRTFGADALLHDGIQQDFLAMEYVEGQTLRDLLEELERVPEELCRHIGREVAKGLAAIHESGVVHRDLKPENVLITKEHVVTGDFNTAEGSPTMAFLRGERTLPDEHGVACTNPIPLVDTYRVLHPDAKDAGSASGFGGRRKSGKIDHVLVAAGAATIHEASIVRTHTDGRYPSDHFAVTAVVEWP